MSLHHRSPPQGGLQAPPASPSEDGSVPKLAEGPWADIENDILRRAIEQFQGHPIRTLSQVLALPEKEKKITFKWSNVATHCQTLGCLRNAKQCRERYINHMAPVRRDKISPEEGLHIMQLVSTHGQKWAWLGRELNRPENTVKNYWNQERKKRENGKKRTSSQSLPARQAETGRHQGLRAYSYPQASREHPHSRRESLSSNPGLVSDHGSPVEPSPRSSRHNSFAPVQQLPLPVFQGSKPAPASPIQSGYPMDRTQALSASSAYSSGFPHIQGASPTHEQFYQRGHPMFPHHSDGHAFSDRRGQPQQHAERGLEHRSYSHSHTQGHDHTHAVESTFPAHTQARPAPYTDTYEQQTSRQGWAREQQAREQQAREPYYERRVAQNPQSYSISAPRQSPAAPQMNLPYRTQSEQLPPVSSIMNITVDVHHPQQLSAESQRPTNARGSTGGMDLRSILN